MELSWGRTRISIKKNKNNPRVYIESINLFNKPIPKKALFNDQIKFKSDENVITFTYAALNFLNPQKCSYKFVLEGFDDTWRPITKSTSTTYTNLDPGDYIFKVKATNDEGVWSNYADQVKITIIPPWYKTNCFSVLMALSFLLILVSFFRYKAIKSKKETLRLEKIILLRTKEIREKNEDLKSANKQAEKQKNNITFLMKELQHRTKNNLQIISSLLNIQSNYVKNAKARQMLSVAKNRIITMSYLECILHQNKEHFNLKTFILDLCDNILTVLSDENKELFSIAYNLTNCKVKDLNTSILGLIINELITNTCKYAFDSFGETNILQINSEIKNNNLILTIKDNGKGYDTKAVSTESLGINLVRHMTKQLNGKLNIISNNTGTTNTLIIPITCI